MGLLTGGDWASALYVGFQTGGALGGGYGASAVRKSFATANKAIARATLYASALGWYRPFINGQRVGSIEQAPGWTDYPQRRHYQTYDVTGMVTQNATNAVAMQLGDGQYLGKMSILGRNYYATDVPRGLALLVIDYADGTTLSIPSDATWKGRATANTANDWYDGATHDARADYPFASAALDDSLWASVTTLARNSAKLQAMPCPPVRRQESIPALARSNPSGSIYIFDLGQNHAGLPQITVAGQSAGTQITVRHGEDLKPDGTLYTGNLRGAASTDRYTCRGASVEVFEPLHVYHGYRYVEVTGHTGVPPLANRCVAPSSY